MKYLIVLVVVLVGIWFWRNNRRAALREKAQSRAAAKPVAGPHQHATEVVECAVCSLHLPRIDALPGGRGMYCSEAHRRQAEK
ncbi:MAG TPA: PP0621 family protein [Polaromonas sp.]|uniref:PP0621 family protein n=1 Tax=Polaromonas sp. TaxID=1869339 RepID=UPI002D38878C|nr:PP0621 family protein [Polaromonas sp.]HYW58606.1 PP0621 family protein [Polaromonas sp.]